MIDGHFVDNNRFITWQVQRQTMTVKAGT